MPGVTGMVEELIGSGMIDAADLARVTGATPRSVSRLLELKTVVDLLQTVLRDEPARLWLRSPNRELGWRKPLDLVAEGNYQRVVGAILAIAEGVTA